MTGTDHYAEAGYLLHYVAEGALREGVPLTPDQAAAILDRAQAHATLALAAAQKTRGDAMTTEAADGAGSIRFTALDQIPDGMELVAAVDLSLGDVVVGWVQMPPRATAINLGKVMGEVKAIGDYVSSEVRAYEIGDDVHELFVGAPLVIALDAARRDADRVAADAAPRLFGEERRLWGRLNATAPDEYKGSTHTLIDWVDTLLIAAEKLSAKVTRLEADTAELASRNTQNAGAAAEFCGQRDEACEELDHLWRRFKEIAPESALGDVSDLVSWVTDIQLEAVELRAARLDARRTIAVLLDALGGRHEVTDAQLVDVTGPIIQFRSGQHATTLLRPAEGVAQVIPIGGE